MSRDAGDTIAAVSSAAGPSPRGIVRLSGADALPLLSRLLADPVRDAVPPENYRSFSARLDVEGTPVPARVYVMRAPTSYTREDVVELHTFGSPVLQRRLLDALAGMGARPAQPGEFTRRAFLNGRIDLAQAESVQALIRARTEAEHRAALQTLSGRLSRRIRELRSRLIDLAAAVEASLDFSDQDVPCVSRDEIAARLSPILADLRRLLASAEAGRLPSHLAQAALFGPPNAGKSSLFNAILRRRRAIVSPRPGTTRDAIEACAVVRGLRLLLLDTAGLRPAEDDIEAQAVSKARRSVESAALAVCVLDSVHPPDALTRESLDSLPPGRGMIVLNKSDLGPCHPGLKPLLPPGVETRSVSAVTGAGVPELLEGIRDRVESGRLDRSPGGLMVAARHARLLARAAAALERVLAGGPSHPMDLVAADLGEALASLSELTGDAVTEDVLDRIFASFCVGK